MHALHNCFAQFALKPDSVAAHCVLFLDEFDAIAKLRPSTLDELSRLPGIGPAKRERYGTDILEVVATSS